MTDVTQAAEEHPDRLFDHLRFFIEGIEARPVLPEQFFAQHASPIPAGELRIRFRVLFDALAEYRKTAFATSKRGQRAHRQTVKWFLDTNVQWPYSFVRLCEVFNLDPDACRAALKRWRKREQERRYEDQAKASREGEGPECCPSLPPQGRTDEASERAEGRGAQHAA